MVEAMADSALAAFRRVPTNRGRLLTTGIFAWSRHPNYFGEAVLWWGLGILAWGMTGQILALAGPALLTLLLLKVSGIPPLEAHLSARPGFAAYAAQVPAFVPRPPKAAGSAPAARDA
jgi:steroid 5-alpha reductase family enzyme